MSEEDSRRGPIVTAFALIAHTVSHDRVLSRV
jgi:hypothetical protein